MKTVDDVIENISLFLFENDEIPRKIIKQEIVSMLDELELDKNDMIKVLNSSKDTKWLEGYTHRENELRQIIAEMKK